MEKKINLVFCLLVMALMALPQQKRASEFEVNSWEEEPVIKRKCRGGSVVKLDNDGAMILNGKRTFVYGAIRDPSDDWHNFDGVIEAGFNMTHHYPFESFLKEGYTQEQVDKLIADAGEYMDLAKKVGIGVWYGLPREAVWDQDTATLTRVVKALRDKSALCVWYLMDEPGAQGKIAAVGEQEEKERQVKEALEKINNLVKQLDPNHPTTFVHSGKGMRRHPYISQLPADMIWVDTYLTPFSVLQIGLDIEECKKIAPDKKAIWGLPEAGERLVFSQRYRLTTSNRSKYLKEVKPFYFPMRFSDKTALCSPKAIRAQAHACIAGGAHGILYYWAGKNMYDLQEDMPLKWQALVNLGMEFRELNEVLVSTDPVPSVEVTMTSKWGVLVSRGDKPDVMWWSRMYEGKLYMGFVCDYGALEWVKVKLPYDFERVVQYPGSVTVLSRRMDGEYDVNGAEIDAPIWNINGRTLEFVLNDVDIVVWRFDPVELKAGD